MDLQPVTLTPGLRLLCCHCGKWGATLADLKGSPFRAFYHPACITR